MARAVTGFSGKNPLESTGIERQALLDGPGGQAMLHEFTLWLPYAGIEGRRSQCLRAPPAG
jgi:hypothetical protein